MVECTSVALTHTRPMKTDIYRELYTLHFTSCNTYIFWCFDNYILLAYVHVDAIKKKSFIKRFETFQHLKTYARDAEDARLWGKIYVSIHAKMNM